MVKFVKDITQLLDVNVQKLLFFSQQKQKKAAIW